MFKSLTVPNIITKRRLSLRRKIPVFIKVTSKKLFKYWVQTKKLYMIMNIWTKYGRKGPRRQSKNIDKLNRRQIGFGPTVIEFIRIRFKKFTNWIWACTLLPHISVMMACKCQHIKCLIVPSTFELAPTRAKWQCGGLFRAEKNSISTEKNKVNEFGFLLAHLLCFHNELNGKWREIGAHVALLICVKYTR